MAPVFLITGASAAGKSTVAALLAGRFQRGVMLSGDAFRRAIVAGRAEPEPDATGELPDEAAAQLMLRYRIAAQAVDTYAAAGFAAVWQDVVIGPVLRDAVGLVRTRPRYVVVLAPTADVLTARNAARVAERGKDGYGAWSTADLDTALRATTPRIGMWLDTSGQTAEETVDEILRRAPDEAAV